MHVRAPRLEPLPYLGGPGKRKTRDGHRPVQCDRHKRSACVEVRAFQHVVHGLGVHAERTADTHRGQLSVVHQSIYRHLADPHQTGHFRDGEKLSTWRLAVGSAGFSLAARRIAPRWPVHRRHRNPFVQARAVPAASPPLAPTRAYTRRIAWRMGLLRRVWANQFEFFELLGCNS
jgi:hypothetical protein